MLVAGCGDANKSHVFETLHFTTNSAIAIANLDDLIDQSAGEAGVEELLLLRSQMLADCTSLDRVVDLSEGASQSADELLRRSRSRSAVHRFADALSDVEAALRAGANRGKAEAQRASILIAVGRTKEVLARLESNAVRRPGFASHSALATAYASVGRLTEADQLYAAALADLETTLPFPYAWIYFKRGLMWTEQGHDPQRGEAMYVQALRYLPEFAAANLHLAELELARQDLVPAMARLERVTVSCGEPEALALLGRLHMRAGHGEQGRQEIASARLKFEALLAKHPLAFADHAAEFYLGVGDDAERAWILAQKNLTVRQTRRAYTLAIQAARATNRLIDARLLKTRMHATVGPRAA